jgi:hypothetical protein
VTAIPDETYFEGKSAAWGARWVQIACTRDTDGEPILFALDNRGRAWHAYYSGKDSRWIWRIVNAPSTPEGA